MSRKQKAPIDDPAWDDPAPDDVPSRQVDEDPQTAGAAQSTAEAMPVLAAFDPAAFFGPDGPLAAQMYGYEQRPSQVEMAAGVRQAILDHKHALIEAPTGTGKSVAYLVPAILSGKTVVVVHRQQVAAEPAVSEGHPLSAPGAGPRDPRRRRQGAQQLCLQPEVGEGAGGAEATFRSTTVRTTRSSSCAPGWMKPRRATWTNCPFVLGGDLRPRVVSFPDDCLHGDCRHDEDNCWVNFMRDAAAEAQVIITNHHLLLNALELGFAGERILPPASVYVDRRGASPGADRHGRLRDGRHRLYGGTAADPDHAQGACAGRGDRAAALSQHAGLSGSLEPEPRQRVPGAGRAGDACASWAAP